MKKRTFWQKAGAFFSGKGFYMVLAVCLCAIGVSGWYLWQTVQLAGDSLAQSASGKATVTVTEDENEVPPEQDPSVAGDGAEGKDVEDAVSNAGESTPTAGETTPAAKEDDAAETADPDKDGAAKTSTEDEQPSQKTSTEDEQPAQETSTGTQKPVETSVETVDNLHQTMQYPVPGSVVSAFSSDILTYNETLGDWRTHNGVDLSAEVGDTVVAAWAGKVTSVRQDAVLGTVVTVDCGEGCTTVYGNLAETTAVTAGDTVSAGDTIGTVGETAAGEGHDGAAFLHFEVLENGQYVDPMIYLAK